LMSNPMNRPMSALNIQRVAPESTTASNRLVLGAFLCGNAMLTLSWAE